MNNKNCLSVLRAALSNPGLTQRGLAEEAGVSVGTANAAVKKLKTQGFLAADRSVTAAGLEALAPYAVDNAIIISGSNAVSLEPLSFEMPDGLISVKGERLIERLIRQLRDAGIGEIVLVVGKNINKYLYLRDKSDVKIVINNEYTSGKTMTALYAARNYLKNTYICKSDNYYPENPFKKYEFESFICAVDAGTADAYDAPDAGHVGKKVYYGHAYMDKKMSEEYLDIIHRYYDTRQMRESDFEDAVTAHTRELFSGLKQYSPMEIIRISDISTLYAFDKKYTQYNDIRIFENICTALKCQRSDITYMEPLQKGMNNKSFKFYCKGVPYVYRHPGLNAENLRIDRVKEAKALRIAKELGVDDTLVCVNEEEGWKVSKFVFMSEEFDFRKPAHTRLLAEQLKKLHDSKIELGYDFDYWEESEALIGRIKERDLGSYLMLTHLRDRMWKIRAIIEGDPWQKTMCHNDLYEPNLLVELDKLYVIDWEFAGDTDIGFDVCKLFAANLVPRERLDDYLVYYFGRETSEREKDHLLACAALQYYYWYIWSVFAEGTVDSLPEYMLLWHDRMVFYINQVEKEYLYGGER